MGRQMIYPPPVHIREEPTEPQPMRPQANIEALVVQQMALDAQRLQNPDSCVNIVAYDSHEPVDLRSTIPA